MIHLRRAGIHAHDFPDNSVYPFCLKVFSDPRILDFNTGITFFTGGNGSGKSTLLKALARRCSVHIWDNDPGLRVTPNPHEDRLNHYLSVEWQNGVVKGAFFSSQIFSHFARNLEEWAVNDKQMLNYFGGGSLVTQSHGQSLMAYFKSRFTVKGIYFLDEPETALSPASLIDLANLIRKISCTGQAQFIIASHSPILLACPEARILDFNQKGITAVAYEQTEYYKVYKAFMNNPETFIK